MRVLSAPSITYAYRMGLRILMDYGVWEDTRNGRAIVCPDAVTTSYLNPRSRVLFEPKRDANPFFHLFEALWMLAGRQDVAFLSQFVKRIANYSDDGRTFHGAYGHRWRVHFGFDQLKWAVDELKSNGASRQVIVGMWDPYNDARAQTKDKPCNDMVKFEARKGVLDMWVFNRSNDMIWGGYGANVVHMSLLMEYIAAQVGVPLGVYEQISTNFHAYETTWRQCMPLDRVTHEPVCIFTNLVTNPDSFDDELANFLNGDLEGAITVPSYDNRFLPDVAWPMFHAHRCYKNKNVHAAIGMLEYAIATAGSVDWLVAGREWLLRRSDASGV